MLKWHLSESRISTIAATCNFHRFIPLWDSSHSCVSIPLSVGLEQPLLNTSPFCLLLLLLLFFALLYEPLHKNEKHAGLNSGI